VEKINYRADLLITDFEPQQLSLEAEINGRTQITSGSYRDSGMSYGIVSETNPVGVTESSQPLAVVSGTVPLKVNINLGKAITKNGNLIRLDSALTEQSLADETVGVVNLVIAEYKLTPTDNRVSIFDRSVDVPARYVVDAPISIVKLTDFNDVTLYSADRKLDIVVLAAVTVYSTATSTLALDVETGNTTYSYIRPWFSPVDIEHRSKLGTGIATEQNVHALSFKDLTSSGLLFYTQFLSHGIILHTDESYPFIPGLLFTQNILSTSILTDSTGDITGTINAKYFVTTHYPLQLGACYETATPQNKIAVTQVIGKPLYVLSDYDVAVALTVQYFYSKALEVPSTLTNNTLQLTQPEISKQVLITEGIDYEEISSPAISLESSGPIPKNFRLFLDKDGVLIKNPNIVLHAIKLDNLPSPYLFNTALYANAFVSIGLTAANTGAAITLKIVGKDKNGINVNENLVFGPSWTDTVLPATAENPDQFVTSVNCYSELTSIEIISRAGDGSGSTIIAYLNYESTTYRYLPLYDIFWNGQAIAPFKVKDIRPVQPFLLEEHPIYSSQEAPMHTALFLNKALDPSFPYTNTSYLLASEDFHLQKLVDTIAVDSLEVRPKASITVDVSKISTDDTITVNSGKVITAKSPIQINIASRARATNVATIVTQTPHGFNNGNLVDLVGITGAGYNATGVAITYISPTSFSYANTGVDEGTTPDTTGTVTLVANNALGEFYFDSLSLSNTYTNMIAAIQNVTFASNVTAAVSGSSLILSKQNGAADDNSFVVTRVETTPGAIVVSGYKNGFKVETATVRDRFVKYLDSELPASNHWVKENKYRSNALTVPESNCTTLLFLLYEVERFDNIYVKPTYQARPDVYEPDIAVSATSVPNVKFVTFANPVAKFYFEVFGKMKGLSIYTILP